MGLIGPTSYTSQSNTSEGLNQSLQQSQSTNQSSSNQNAFNNSVSNTYIPEYSQTPILNEIAQYSRSMAPQVYAWGMDQYNKNQGDIDALMRNGQTYAGPQRIATDVGMAESGVQQAGEAARQNSIRDLESYGIDPSSGRYAALDNASRIATAASAAGAGNQQRMADIAQGNAMENQAVSSSLQNVQTGYGAAAGENALLGTAMSLKYPPLGQTSTSTGGSTGTSQSSGQSTGFGTSLGVTQSAGASQSGSQNQLDIEPKGTFTGGFAGGGSIPSLGYAAGGDANDASDGTSGGFVSQDLSPTEGARTDDVDARLNAGEFVIPKDVAAWKGQEFFYKLMAQSRKMRATAGSQSAQQAPMGYAEGGDVEDEMHKREQEATPKSAPGYGAKAMDSTPDPSVFQQASGGPMLPYGAM
jgi:hypothetical protein